MKYIVSDELTKDKIREIINDYSVNQVPKLNKKMNYFLGKHDILKKTYSDPSKPCNKIVTNFCKLITDTYLGYNIGIPVSYDVDDKIQDFLLYNDVTDKDNMLLRNALIYGKSYELQWIDELKQNRFDIIDTPLGIDIYSDELEKDELKAFIRMYYTEYTNEAEGGKFTCEVYDKDKIDIYKGVGNFAVINNMDFVETIPHYFHQVPVCVMSLNPEQQGIFEQILSLQDAYNELQSDEVDDYSAFVDAYLCLYGVTADDEDVQKMKENRVLSMDTDCRAEYLVKEVNDTQIKNMTMDIKDNILKITSCPDFSDEKFMSDSGIALEYKLVGFSNVSKAIMNRMERTLRKRLELFTNIESIKGESEWRDVNIVFTENLPANIEDTAQTINLLRGIVSQRSLLQLLPFIKDVDKEIKLVKSEQEITLNPYNTFVESTEEDEVLEEQN